MYSISFIKLLINNYLSFIKYLASQRNITTIGSVAHERLSCSLYYTCTLTYAYLVVTYVIGHVIMVHDESQHPPVSEMIFDFCVHTSTGSKTTDTVQLLQRNRKNFISELMTAVLATEY